MMRFRLLQNLKMRFRTFRQLLLVLCMVSLVAFLILHKSKIIARVYPSQPEDKRVENRNELEEYNQEEDISEAIPTEIDANSEDSTTMPKPLTTKRLNMSTLRPTKSNLLASKEPSHQATNNRNPVTSQSSRPQTTTRKIITTTFNLGDAYATDDMHVNSKCPNRTRDKFQNSQSLEKKFLKTVPVLQWKKHAQESEYERLRQFSGAQGWMGVTWKILNETLNLLNSTGNGYMFDTWNGSSPCIRCAVVGNGGILNGSGIGKEIDSHDFIFRVNGAVINGFEQDVGKRTSFYFFGTNTMMNSLGAYRAQGFKSLPRTEETRFVLLPDHDRDYLLVRAALTNSSINQGHDKGKIPMRYFGENLTTEHFKILHPDFMRYLRNRFLWSPILNTRNRDIYRPSTGASILLAAIHTCDQVSAYGFMTPNYEKFSDHYFDTKYNKVAFYANHNFRKEMALWQELHQAGVITLYMRD